ncbi:inter-alpha-trypsin inhibitor heavy chain H3-like [Spea bombifrons]|uniref:inter-alpha-trypsin inhibitor heavy chain H3-like n=1 Tax=Spea bombifrons TaxID=233779 RepID=UPI00234A8DBC|nr:inter-alpha-trypsin inhibitor heavy chain H3-like [Spea bombifrons]
MKAMFYITLFFYLVGIHSTLKTTLEQEDVIRIHSLHVTSLVTSRFSRTIITSMSSNQANVSKEVSFDVELPKEAFISNFSLTIEGKVYVGVVKEKGVAQKIYTDSVSRGRTAGIVKASGRLFEKFGISVNVAPKSEVVFMLTYEELLRRKFGQYEILLKIKPNQLVEDFQIEVHIDETRALRFLDADATFLTNDLRQMVEKSYSDNKGHVFFKPSLDVQRSCSECTSTLLNGEFIVKYDVDRSNDLGEIQIINGYFVHFFAPTNLPQLPKKIVFVIDVSGSMSGQKIKQTKKAMLRIIEDLNPEDNFNIAIFNSTVVYWKQSLVKADRINVEHAKKYITSLSAGGGTNLNEALLSAVRQILQTSPTGVIQGSSAPMIIMLTDGDPSVGETQDDKIQVNVKQAINDQISLYCLGFGQDLNYKLLQTLALENGGVARRIYEDSDADLQLQGFYKEVAYPLLTGVQLTYPENVVSHLTKSTFPLYHKGSEIIVAGKVSDNELTELPAEITGYGVDEHLSFTTTNLDNVPQGYIFGEYTERLWAYLTIQQLLEKEILAKGEDKEYLKSRALALSLKYNFVTPLSSMVVTKPEESDEKPPVAAEKEEHKNIPKKFHAASATRKSFVDGDPHFIVKPSDVNLEICFNVKQSPGVFLNLVEDPVTGISVYCELVGKNKDGSTDASGNTYIGKLGFQSLGLGIQLEVTTETITITNSKQKTVFSWNKIRVEAQKGLTLRILDERRLAIIMDKMITFIVVLHRPLKEQSKHRDYLGLYTEDVHQLSKNTYGILGQFYHYIPMEISNVTYISKGIEATLSVRGKTTKVYGQQRKNYHQYALHGESTFCWFIEDGLTWLTGKSEDEFLVPTLYKSQVSVVFLSAIYGLVETWVRRDLGKV